MKFHSALYAALACSQVALAAPAAEPSFQSSYVAPVVDIEGPGVFATTDQRLFNFAGTVGYMAGTNAWYLSHMLSDADVDLSMKQISNAGLKVVRVWGFGSVNSDPGADTVWFMLLNSTGAYLNYGLNGIPRIDSVIASAQKYGLKVVLPFNNNWGDLGGIASYSAAFGGNATTWYTDKRSQKAYKMYVKALVTRYKQSPAIFAWELMNEPRCRTCPTSVITTWATKISAYIKSLDKNHMVTLGDEGWLAPADGIGDGSYAYSGYEGVDFEANLQIADLDYGVFHLYPDSWGYNYTWGSEWITQHDALGKKYGKPVVLEEYGTPFPHNHTGTEGPWQETVLCDTSVAMDQFWQFGTEYADGTISDWDVNTIWHNDTEWQTLAVAHAKAMSKKSIN